MPSHYLNQCWNIVTRTPGNNLQWNLNRNLYIFIQKNAFENVVWKMAAILSRPQWVKEGVCFCMKPSIWYLLTWWQRDKIKECHYSDVIISAMASQITDVSIVYRTACLGADQRKHTKLRLTGLGEENSPVTGEFPAQMTSDAENVSIWWRHHGDEWSLWHTTQCV